MQIEQEFPELSKLFNAGFARPVRLDHKEIFEWRIAARLPEPLLETVAKMDDLVDPVLPDRAGFNQLSSYYRRRFAKKFPDITKTIFVACWGYLPVLGLKDAYSHPWRDDIGPENRLCLELDSRHFEAFTLWRIRVASDAAEDRKLQVVGVRDKRVLQ